MSEKISNRQVRICQQTYLLVKNFSSWAKCLSFIIHFPHRGKSNALKRLLLAIFFGV